MASLAERLTNRVDLYGKIEYENELKEKDFRYGKIKSIWCEIIPVGGSLKTLPGNGLYADVSHRITIRSKSVTNLTKDMYFIDKNKRFDIKFSQDNYKYKDSIEIMCSLVVE
ncbi:MAG: head-tail adaptor protein [Clostridium sp.]